MTPDLKFHAENTYIHDEKSILEGIETASIKPAVEAFLANIRRLKLLHEIPSEVGFLNTAFLIAVLQDAFHKTPLRELETKQEREDRLFLEYLQDKIASEDQDVIKQFDRLFSLAGDRLTLGLESILNAEVTGAWTAFEVLAGDLWESSLNCRPMKLATLDAARSTKAKEEKSQATASIPLHLLQKHKFDVQDKMGTILREKLSFVVLDKIRDSYRRAFGDGAVLAIIDSGKQPDPMNTLSFLRNVIVHRAGIADEDFETRAKMHPRFGAICSGEKVPIDGEIVHEVVSEALTQSFNLINGVDEWLVANP